MTTKIGYVTFSDDEIRHRLALGENSGCEFKQVEFSGDRPIAPHRNTLADEMAAFANTNGGTLFCGVTADGQIQGMSTRQLVTLNRLLAEVSVEALEPVVPIHIYHHMLDGKKFLLADVPRSDSIHERAGCAYIRVGATKRPLPSDERICLARNRARNQRLGFDNQIMHQTGFETLDERLWEPILSAAWARDPRQGLMNLRLLAKDESNAVRATVAGILLCTKSPQEWLPQATITATHYRGLDRSSGQLDAQEITGPLSSQVFDALKFVFRNMRVAARKLPEREDMPQYSESAVFEAIVNAVAHRDYSIHSRRIRLSMFKDRLEIDSPGQLPNGMTIEGMAESQSTRNNVIASVFGRTPVEDVPGANQRRYLMERRGDGVAIILNETKELTGIAPEYRIVDNVNLVLSIPAAKLELSPADSTVTVHSKGDPLSGVEVLALYPNKTWVRGVTNEAGEAGVNLYTTHLPMTVYVATPGHAAGIERNWMPNRGGLVVELDPHPDGGAAIFENGTGHLPGLSGRLNPKRDTSDRTYLYADNIAIENGRQQPVAFRVGKPMSLTDAFGAELSVTIVDIIGRSALIEYQPVAS